jgi:uroporphyrinogen-III synthase
MSMLQPLHGMRVGLLQSRYAHELAALIQREGGVPLMAPCLREVRNEDDDELRARLGELVGAPPDVFVFQTGVGTQALFDLAGAAGLHDRLADAVRGAFVVARGPKPLTVLLRLGFRVDRRTAVPHTTRELLWLLEAFDVSGRRVAVQHYGSANLALVDQLRDRGAEVIELFSYRWALPDDVAPIVRFLRELDDGRVAVTAFTSAAQVENLFLVASDTGVAGDLAGWLSERTVTAAIGPTCAGALERRGVVVAIQPEVPKMVPFVRAIRDHFSTS